MAEAYDEVMFTHTLTNVICNELDSMSDDEAEEEIIAINCLLLSERFVCGDRLKKYNTNEMEQACADSHPLNSSDPLQLESPSIIHSSSKRSADKFEIEAFLKEPLENDTDEIIPEVQPPRKERRIRPPIRTEAIQASIDNLAEQRKKSWDEKLEVLKRMEQFQKDIVNSLNKKSFETITFNDLLYKHNKLIEAQINTQEQNNEILKSLCKEIEVNNETRSKLTEALNSILNRNNEVIEENNNLFTF